MAGGADGGRGGRAFFARHADQLFGKLLWAAALPLAVGASGWLLGNWIAVTVGAVIGVGTAVLGLRAFRPKADVVPAPEAAQPTPPPEVQIVPQGGVSVHAVRLPNDKYRLTWQDFEDGAKRLLQQVAATQDDWPPDLIVGIRETGIFLADAVSRHLWPRREERPPLGLAYHQGWAGNRTDIHVALPRDFPPSGDRGGLRVLVVDFLFKTGSAIDSVARELEREGFSIDPDHLRLAVMWLCQLEKLPDAGASDVRLTLHEFKSTETDPDTFERWLPRMSHIAGIGKPKLTPPWKSWEL